ncbi:hypothetical protein [Streptosporangium sp. NPDC002524]|uniref:hypothetical protein n=1 Tax=Streptosporangium sp. NPDC002524 TaxID=3154537 RepID=UPI00332D9C7F
MSRKPTRPPDSGATSRQPRHLALDTEAVHGRGLAIVAALAHDHGVTPLPDRPGKTVWARWVFLKA